jgi:hypothetical protein
LNFVSGVPGVVEEAVGVEISTDDMIVGVGVIVSGGIVSVVISMHAPVLAWHDFEQASHFFSHSAPK